MNEFLRKREQITESTKWLKENGYVTHPISAKDWELAIITDSLTNGNLLDMGANGSFVLHNALKKNLEGRKVGIDLALVEGDNKAEGAEYFQGDMMATPFEDGSFDTIVSQSTIEHDVDLEKFAKECSRLLVAGGKLIVSYDFWPIKINTQGLELYGLKWNILDEEDTWELISQCRKVGLELSGDIDWTTEDAVINPQYCSPFNVSYTFSILEFIKQ